jgi:O-antigen ligase
MIVITPQNSILLITSETGLIGMVAWGVLLTGIVLFAVNGLKVRSSSPVLAVSLLLGASAAIAQSLVDFPMSIPAIAAFWAFLLGYCGGLGGKARRKKRRNRPEASNNQSGRFSRQRISA